MKKKNLSNAFLLTLAFFALVVSLATGCGGGGGGGGSSGPPAGPEDPPPEEEPEESQPENPDATF